MHKRRRHFLAGLLLIVTLLLFFGCVHSPRHRGAVNDHFDGTHFNNTVRSNKSIVDILRFVSTYRWRKEDWPDWVENADYPPPVWAPDQLTVTLVNHSTVLLSVGGFNVLTDPIWSQRASPFSFMGPKRVRNPGLALDELPPIDVILLSHDHYDHLDLPSLKQLQRHGRNGAPLVLAGLGVGEVLQRAGIQHYQELDWGQKTTVDKVTFHFSEVRHRSGRGLTDQMKTLWGGFVIEAPGASIYFAGDTGYGQHFSDSRAEFGDFDLALLPIGAYRPRSFMAPVHLDPEQAVQAHEDLGSQQSVAIHHGTFQLTYEPINEPYELLEQSLESRGLNAEVFRVLGFGESMQLPLRRAQTAINR